METTVDNRIHGFPSFFEPLELLSDNNFTSTWRARRRGQTDECVLKTISPECAVERAAAREILENSFNCQKSLRGENLCLARRLHTSREYFAVEYPLLDKAVWRALTPGDLLGLRNTALASIARCIDFLHDEGMTHGDLKLENFLVSGVDDEARFKLCDLDLLSNGEGKLNLITYGTPGRVAPEAIDENYHSPWSDNYSFGRSLHAALEQLAFEGGVEWPENLVQFAISLSSLDWRSRPYSILLELTRNKLIDSATFESHERSILYQKVLMLFRRVRHAGRKSPDSIASILTPTHKIYGAPLELLRDIVTALQSDRSRGLAAAYKLLTDAQRRRFGGFWHLRVDAQVSHAVYDILQSASIARAAVVPPAPSQAISDKVRMTSRMMRNKECLKAHYFLEATLPPPVAGNPWSIAGRILLARCCCRLDWTNEGVSHYRLALDALADFPRHVSRLYLELIYTHLACGQLEEAYSLAVAGEKISDTLSHSRRRLSFQLAQAWVLSLRGEGEVALEKIAAVARSAEDAQEYDILLKCRYYTGVVLGRQGAYDKSVQCYLDAVALGEQFCLYTGVYAALTGLAQHFFEVGEYGKSIGYAKEAIDTFSHSSSIISMNHAILILAQSNVRLGRQAKALGLLQKYINGQALRPDVSSFSNYYLTRGWASINFGFFSPGRDYLWRFLEMQRDRAPDRRLAKAEQNLAEESLYRADVVSCSRHSARARELFAQFKDDCGILEADLIEELSRSESLYLDPGSALLGLVEKLWRQRSVYYASVGLFHLIARSVDATQLSQVGEALRSLHETHLKSQCPLFEALAEIIVAHPNGAITTRTSFAHLKKAYVRLFASGQLYLAMILCHRLGRLYQERGQFKQAIAFLTQACVIARRLQNDMVERELEMLIAEARTRHSPDRSVGELLLNISESLKLVSKRSEDVYDRLIQIVVNETGAERAALFLRTGDDEELRSVGQFNCDESELEDIEGVSSSITRGVASLAEPLFVEEATRDERTRHFKSVVAYNILSVMCVPLFDGQDLVGVLYLDHHTTPRFFNTADRSLAQAIGNFLAHAVTLNSKHRSAVTQRQQAVEDLAATGVRSRFVSRSPIIRELLDKLRLVAVSNTNVLLCGESGVGKEILAEMIHNLSGRRQRPLVKLNCAAIPITLVESELFGVARGSVSGVGEVEGKLSGADMGTLFMDEVGDLPLEAQAKILRALEQREFQKIGSTRRITIDTRFIFATNKDLREMMKAKTVREDLYYRIATVELHVPPLRSRPEDIDILLDLFLELFAEDPLLRPSFSTRAMRALRTYSWPGNVRQLRNLVEGFCITNKGITIDAHMLPEHIIGHHAVDSLSADPIPPDEAERLLNLLQAFRWNQKAVASAAGISQSTLHRKIRKYRLYKSI